jgi:hypothetical protein
MHPAAGQGRKNSHNHGLGNQGYLLLGNISHVGSFYPFPTIQPMRAPAPSKNMILSRLDFPVNHLVIDNTVACD